MCIEIALALFVFVTVTKVGGGRRGKVKEGGAASSARGKKQKRTPSIGPKPRILNGTIISITLAMTPHSTANGSSFDNR